jgi:hypothetical protein
MHERAHEGGSFTAVGISLALGLVAGCSVVRTDDGATGVSGTGQTGASDPGTAGISSNGDESTAGTAGEGGQSSGPLLDVGADGGDGVGPAVGCDKVDFLFVIDNSLSMGDEQQNLSNSFPAFIQTIQQEVVGDYHVMVIDTDAEDKWIEDLIECHEDKCPDDDPGEACKTIFTCGSLPPVESCQAALGGGIDFDQGDVRQACGIADGKRYLTDAQPNIGDTFECIANLYDGNSPELGMQGMLAALSPEMLGPGGCNSGFLRDDAILVVTFITDEEDDGDSQGDPASWRNDLRAIKGGNQTAVVVLGLLGDTGLPGAVCPPDSVPGSNGGEYSPRLIEFVESFGARGLWGSVCAPDYSDLFAQAVGVIETACDEFTPEG